MDKVYTVIASGHGSSFRFDGDDPNSPGPGPHKSLNEAIKEADRWIGLADSIAGDARVVHSETLEIVWPICLKGRIFVPNFGRAPSNSYRAMRGLG